MLRRLGFRRLLPATQTILYLALVGPFSYETLKLTSQLSSPDAQIRRARETGGFRPMQFDRPAPRRVILALAINLPVVLTAGIAFVPIVPEGARGNAAWLLYLTPFVALLWYGVGLWVDPQLGWIPRSPPSPSTLRRRAWRIAFSLFAGLLLIAIALLVIILAKAIGGTGAVGPQQLGELMMVYTPAVGWSFFVLMVCRQELREFRQATR
jgi:hypothetical protein